MLFKSICRQSLLLHDIDSLQDIVFVRWQMFDNHSKN